MDADPGREPPRGVRRTDASGTLLLARTTSPAPSSRTLTRPRLLAALDEAARCPLTLVSAGPGAGKTQLLIDWVCAGRDRRQIAWVALDDDCNDPHRLWSLVLTAFQRLAPGSEELQSLRAAADVDRHFVEQVVWALGGLDTQVTLVLEDVHEVRARAALDTFEHLIRSVPHNLRVVMVARSDPPLAVHRLRVAGELGEIRQADLSLTRDEAADLFAQHDLELSDVEMDQVLARTEGWAAGLRLAAMSLEGREEPEARAAAVAAFAGDTRAVVDYLMTEVLERQPERLRDFLLETSIVERLDVSLADALVRGGRGAEALDSLERSGALLVALDGRHGWYRYHRLFREMCRHRLAVERPEVVRELHARAAVWFSEHDEPLEALGHASEAQAWDLFAWVAVSRAGALVFGHEGRATRAILRQVPEDAARTDLWMACTRVLACYDEGDLDELERRLAVAEELLTGLDPVQQRAPALVLSLVRAATRRADHDVRSASRHSAQALLLAEGLSAVELPALPRYVALAHVLQGKSLVWSGLLPAAEEHLRKTRQMIEPHHVDESAVLAGAYLSLVLAMQGHLEAARIEALESLAVATDAGWTDDAQSTSAHLALALVNLQRSDYAACELALRQAALTLQRKPDLLLDTARRLACVRLLAQSGHDAEASHELVLARAQVERLPEIGFLTGWLGVIEAEVALAAGRHERVLELVAHESTPERVRGQSAVLSGRALLGLGRAREALAVVDPLRDDDQAAQIAVGAWLVTARAEQSLRHDAAAMAAMERALDRAGPERLLRPFSESLAELRPLLERHRRSAGTHALLVEAILGVDHEAIPVPVEPLTDRELAVLELLPTMMSNSEIADELFVSVNTVKAHLKSLYRKLGVSSRRQAVVRGRRPAASSIYAGTAPISGRSPSGGG